MTAGAVARRDVVPSAPPVLDFDARRRALESRIEHAKEMLTRDVARVRTVVQALGRDAKRGLARVAITGLALMVLGLVSVVTLWRVQKRRARW